MSKRSYTRTKITPRTWTYEKVKEFIEGPEGNGCKLLSGPDEYKSSSTKIRIQCKCGNEFVTKFSNFIHKKKPKKQCNDCGQKLKITSLEEVKKFIEENSDCKFVEVANKEYKGYKSKLNLQCACGKIFKVSFNEFKNGNKRRCNKCAGHYTWSYKEVKEFIEINTSCTLLSKTYEGVNQKLEVRCKCGNIFYPTFASIKDKGVRQCKDCANVEKMKDVRLSYDEVKHFIEVESGSGCKLIEGEYKNINSVLKIRCACGEIFQTSFKLFKYHSEGRAPKQHCNKCGLKKKIEKMSHSYEDVKNYIEIESNSGCKLITSRDEFYKMRDSEKATNIKLRILCNKCKKEEFITTLYTFKTKQKYSCNYCAGTGRKYTYEDVKHYIEVESNSGAKLLSKKYKNPDEKLLLQCKCGEKFWVSFTAFKDPNKLKQQCNKCSGNISKKEIAIEQYLIKYKFDYVKQYRFDDCRNKYPLPFDFAIFKNGKLICLIEYDGPQHDQVIDYWGGEEGLAYRKENDRIKDQYCKKNNIPLIRIKYDEDPDIEYILDGYLRKNRGEIKWEYQLRLAL